MYEQKCIIKNAPVLKIARFSVSDETYREYIPATEMFTFSATPSAFKLKGKTVTHHR